MRSGQSLPLEQEAGRIHVNVVTGELANAEVAPADIAYLEASYRPVDNLLSLGHS